MYVYVQSEPGLWTVGFYTPAGKWEAESDRRTADEAAARVAWLNGSSRATPARGPSPLLKEARRNAGK